MGYVYFLTNHRMPGLVKIGRTIHLAERLEEINRATGVAAPFVMEHHIEAADEAALERSIHQELAEFRFRRGREFFEIPLSYAIKVASRIARDERSAEPKLIPIAFATRHESTLELAAAIRDGRRALGMSQGEFAKMVGCGRRFVSDVENGKDTAQVGLVLKILHALDLRLATVPALIEEPSAPALSVAA